MTFSILLCLLMILPLTSASSVKATSTETAAEAKECVRCHQKMVRKAEGAAYVHRPFIEHKCPLCHLAEQDRSRPGTSPAGNRENRPHRSPDVRWLFRDLRPLKEHWFLLPADRVDDTLFLRILSQRHDKRTLSLRLPPLAKTASWDRAADRPEISDIRCMGFRRSVLLSAVISWKTNQPTRGQVSYGVKSIEEEQTPLNPTLSTDHEAVLSPILPDRTYQFVIRVEDVYGNTTLSPLQTFSTRAISQYLAPVPPPDSDIRPQLHFAVRRVRDQYLIQVRADRPIPLAAGVHRHLRQQLERRKTSSDTRENIRHLPLNSLEETTLLVCKKCHAAYWQGATHPVGIRPKKGMHIPASYPVLEDGRITCISCHAPHGSNFEARMRRSSKQDLCIGCHREYK